METLVLMNIIRIMLRRHSTCSNPSCRVIKMRKESLRRGETQKGTIHTPANIATKLMPDVEWVREEGEPQNKHLKEKMF